VKTLFKRAKEKPNYYDDDAYGIKARQRERVD